MVLVENPGVLNPIQTPSAPQATPAKFSFWGRLSVVLGVAVVVLLGIGTGWWLSHKAGKAGPERISPGLITGQNEAGVLDERTFKGDTAEGILREGGINGEGTHHLERDGGPSQNVYLASTVIDLQAFVGKKVKVWGETQSVKKAGWFMDVAKIKIVE